MVFTVYLFQCLNQVVCREEPTGVALALTMLLAQRHLFLVPFFFGLGCHLRKALHIHELL